MSQQRLELLLELTDRLDKAVACSRRQVQGFAAQVGGPFGTLLTGGAGALGSGSSHSGGMIPSH